MSTASNTMTATNMIVIHDLTVNLHIEHFNYLTEFDGGGTEGYDSGDETCSNTSRVGSDVSDGSEDAESVASDGSTESDVGAESVASDGSSESSESDESDESSESDGSEDAESVASDGSDEIKKEENDIDASKSESFPVMMIPTTANPMGNISTTDGVEAFPSQEIPPAKSTEENTRFLTTDGVEAFPSQEIPPAKSTEENPSVLTTDGDDPFNTEAVNNTDALVEETRRRFIKIPPPPTCNPTSKGYSHNNTNELNEFFKSRGM